MAMCFCAAFVQAKSHGETDVIEDLEAKMVLMGFQKRIAEALAAKSPQSQQLQARMVELRSEPKTLSQLFNDYAREAEMWDLCLEIIGFSNQNLGASEIVVTLWDWYLLQGVRQAECRGWGAMMEEACMRVERLGVCLIRPVKAPFQCLPEMRDLSLLCKSWAS